MPWEQGGVMAPAVVKTDDGYTMIYRAFGDDRISRLGLATSKDGLTWERRSEPVMVPDDAAEHWGMEDPRMVQLDNRLIATYTAANGHDEPDGWHWTTRVRFVTSSLAEAFSHGGERMTPKLPDRDNKDAALLPERVDGSYWLLHRLMPDIWISRSDDLIEWRDHRRIVAPVGDGWQSLRIGAGAPPVRTELGWLLFYHGVSIDLTYSMSALILDLDDPSKVLYRLPYPLLVPTDPDELRGVVPNVVFGTGVTDEGSKWRLYYGEADRAIGVAEIDKAELLDALQDYPSETAEAIEL
jgi:predicted GH43/DUF377 family glycosyl hydrolase